MNVSVNWLSAMLGRPIDPRDAANRLAMLCVPVDSVEPLFEELNDVIVAEVESVKQHPDADRLTAIIDFAIRNGLMTGPTDGYRPSDLHGVWASAPRLVDQRELAMR